MLFSGGEPSVPDEGDKILLVVPDPEYIRAIPGTIHSVEGTDGEFEQAEARLNDSIESHPNARKRFEYRSAPYTVTAYQWVTRASELPLEDPEYPCFYTPYDQYEDHKEIEPDDRALKLKKLRAGQEIIIPDELVTICDHPPDFLTEVSYKSAVAFSAFKLSLDLGEEKVMVCKKCKSIVDGWAKLDGFNSTEATRVQT
ncbi:hypothetical protein [Natronococcus wangiae]|uniref:hypothetical protein n=1 Tax=Natronococcus wangiae TaxID=3068275 RepID=UPI00273F6A6B|nr:hypothetical protein [Natronococcus sp. AD5]